MAKKVKVVTSFRSEIGTFEKDVVNPFYKFRLKEFDDNGNLTLEAEFKPNADKEWECKYEYDKDNRLLSRETLYPLEGTMEKTLHFYDENGHKIRDENYFDEDLFEKINYVFDKNGNMITQTRLDEDDNEIEKQESEFNENNQMLTQLFYQNGTLERKVGFTYDEGGRCISEIHSGSSGKVKERVEYSYNEQGKKTSSTSRDSAGNIIGYVDVEYDEHMNPVKYASETSGYYNSKAVNQITYDDEGRAIENEYYDVLNSFLMSKERIWYDEEGNVKEEEIFEINPQAGMKKNHYRLQMQYDFYTE
jgi:hypothetical protein